MEKTNKAKKPSWFKELKAEFNRIIWPTKERIAKETAVVEKAEKLDKVGYKDYE